MSFRIPITVSAMLLCLSVTISAQTTGRVSGRVLDQTGAVLPGVAIDLVVNSRELTTTTDDQGVYRFDAVPTGNGELTFRRLNFSVLRRSARVASGVPVTADVVLTLSLGADVVVTAAGTFRNIADVDSDIDYFYACDCQASPREVSRTSTPIRLSPVRLASVSSFRFESV